MSIASVRLNPDLGIGAVLAVLRTAAIVAGLAAFVELVFRRVRHMGLAAATGLAVLEPAVPGGALAAVGGGRVRCLCRGRAAD